MDYLQKWKVLEYHGEGGQGKVYRVCEEKEYSVIKKNLTEALKMIKSGAVYYDDQRKGGYDSLREWFPKMLRMEDPANQFALKVLHEPKDARDAKLAKERIQKEIGAMSKNLHPNLIKLEDSDPDGKWFVSQFYTGGTLAEKRDVFKGDLLSALKAVRPVVEGVAELHKKDYVHRDIKPENVFVGAKNELVLGDFGLVFFEDVQHTRISETYENVGSRDWMPPWAMGIRIEEVKPTFDVFSLGKLLWSMVTGKHILHLWYFDRKKYNVELLFPNARHMRFANQLFKKCIVQEEEDCIPNAGKLLEEIDTTISTIELDADLVDLKVKRPCKVCGVGKYELAVNDDLFQTRNFGFNPTGSRRMKIFTCTNCGNVQLFSYDKETLPPAWRPLPYR